MSDPLTDKCDYCGSPAVLDDAWFCDDPECWAEYERETREQFERRAAEQGAA